MSGLFIEKIDWNDPRFAPWHIEKLGKLNDAQKTAFFDEDDDDDLDSNDDATEICLKVPCRVELNHANVCYGTEKAWPNKVFNKATFNDLEPKEKRALYRLMEAEAVKLYNKYVDHNRLERRRKRRTNRALAYYYEEKFRKNRFLRIQALGGTRKNANCSNPSSQNESIYEDENDLSLQTVINTGNTRSNESKKTDEHSVADLNDNHLNSNNDGNDLQVNEKRFTNSPLKKRMSSHQNKRILPIQHTNRTETPEHITITEDSSDGDNDQRLNSEDRFCNIHTESIVNATNTCAECESNLICATPNFDLDEFRDLNPYSLNDLRNGRRIILEEQADLEMFDSEEAVDEPNSLDFLSQSMAKIITSTQQ